MTQMDADGGGEGKRDPRTHAVIGAAMEVHSCLGYGFLESVYQEALALEFITREIRFAAQIELPIAYEGRVLGCGCRADFVCYDQIIVEIKALADLHENHHAQLINYLKATGLSLGLLINFGSSRLAYKRSVRSVPSA